MLMSIKFPPKMVGIHAYAESTSKFMGVTSTPKYKCTFGCLNSHSFVDDIVNEYNDVDSGFEDDGEMEEDMNSHGALTQDSTKNNLEKPLFIVYEWYLGFDFTMTTFGRHTLKCNIPIFVSFLAYNIICSLLHCVQSVC